MEDSEALDAFLTKDAVGMQQKIEATELSDGAKAFLRELAAHVGKAYQAQAERLERESRQSDVKTWQVVTELVPQDEVAKRHLFPVLTEEQGSSFFYDGTKEDVDAFFSKDVSAQYEGEHDGTPFYYRLEPDDRYAQAEQPLFRLAEQEHRSAPVLFSPWARRAVRVILGGAMEAATLTLDDLQLQKNGLVHADGTPLLLDGKLCWNVQMEEVEPYAGPELTQRAGREGQYVCYYPWMPERQEALLSHVGARFIDVETMTEEASKQPPSFVVYTTEKLDATTWTATLFTFAEDETVVSSNAGKRATLSFAAKQTPALPQRLLTEGDVNRLLRSLATPFGRAELLSPEVAKAYGATDVIRSYTFPAYQYYTSPLLNRYAVHRDRMTLALAFSADDPRFLTDYANYVRHYLARCYPEFQWRCYKKKADV